MSAFGFGSKGGLRFSTSASVSLVSAPRKYTEIYARARNFGCAHAHFIPSCVSRVKRLQARNWGKESTASPSDRPVKYTTSH